MPVLPGGLGASQPLTLGDDSVLFAPSHLAQKKKSDNLPGKRPRKGTVLTGEPKTLLFSGLELAARFVVFCRQGVALLLCFSIFPEKETISDLQSCSRAPAVLT